ncbi:MAG: hypothetical protein U1F66_11640 [bacterium]
MKKYSQLALGPNYTLVLSNYGAVWGWGANNNGNLGIGKFSNSEPSPLKLSGIKDIVEIGAGLVHGCALTKGQDVYCWGNNELGQLGAASPLNAVNPLPGKVPINGIKKISVGLFNTCGLSDKSTSNQSGEVFCWGNNSEGELGIPVNKDPNANVYNSPIKSNIFGVVSLSLGQMHTCELVDPNAAQTTQAYTPTEASALPICFGENSFGQLGTGSTQAGNLENSIGVKNISAGKVHQMSAGADHTCALTTADAGGLVYCWGFNQHGQLGNLTTENSSLPSQVKLTVSQPLAGIKEVLAQASRTCAVTDKGTAYCWGNNSSGQLGDGTKIDHYSPTQVMLSPNVPLTGVKTMAIGYSHSCAIVSVDPNKDDKIYCWGSNSKSQLGLGAGAPSSSYPLEVKMPFELSE